MATTTMSRSFFSPPPSNTAPARSAAVPRSSQRSRDSKPQDSVVNMDTLVWPPPRKEDYHQPQPLPRPQLQERYHVSAPTSPHSHDRGHPYPQAKASAARRGATKPDGHYEQHHPHHPSHRPEHENMPHQPPPQQRRVHSSPSHITPTQARSHPRNHNTTSPLRPSIVHSNSSPSAIPRAASSRHPIMPPPQYPIATGYSTSSSSDSYPENGNPLPPPPVPISSTYIHQPQQPFFEPLTPNVIPIPVIDPVTGYVSPVMDRQGQQIRGMVCRLPPGLGPGGVIQPGWPEEFVRERISGHSFPRSLHPPLATGYNTPNMSSLRQSPLRYRGEEESESESDESESTTSSSYERSRQQHQQHNPPAHSHPINPTRIGYWNRRGDTIGPSGHIRPAPSTQRYPPDLDRYPEHALMNEVRELTLPATLEERVLSWREAM